MNLKKLPVYGLFLALAGIFGILTINQAFAAAPIPVVASDIDTDASTVSVAFVGEAGGPLFSCFGMPNNPAIQTFTDLSWVLADFPNPSIDLDNCFQQAGTYNVTIHLQDNAGNSIEKGPYTYTVTAGNPDPGAGVLLSQIDCANKQANNTDECKLELQLLDAFGNPVTQLTEASLSLETLGNAFIADDANTGDLSFVEGLTLEGFPAINTPGAPVALTGASGTFDFSLKAISPSVKTIIMSGEDAPNVTLAQLVGRTLAFTASVLEINPDGTSGPGSISLNFDAPDITFKHLFSLKPSGSGFLWEGDASPGQVDLDLEFAGTDTSITNRTGGIYEDNGNLGYTAEDIYQSRDMTNITTDSFNTTATGEPTDPQTLRFYTDIAYQVGGNNVEYPAGGTGFDAELADLGINPADVIGYNTTSADVSFIGADIEGGVIGSLVKMEMQPGTQTFNISETTAKLRDQITENAFRLARGSSNIQAGNFDFDPDWFSTYDVAIVEGDVTFPAGGILPSGKKTLIIKNGNFIVKEDMTYANTKEDSFGVILVNDDQGDRGSGNIFVRSNVRTMVGSYYADGGLMTNNEGAPTVANSSNSETENPIQLLLTGTLFSRNTLGGSMIHDELAGPPRKYYLPWGTTEEKIPARQYDLHYVRRYTNADPANCAPVAGSCDLNENAFVIRIDRKASVAPPPGFESSGDIMR